MQAILPYVMMPVMASMLVVAQALWATAIKHDYILNGSPLQIMLSAAMSWKMWVGAIIYVLATFVYFFMLSKLKFFSVQIPMTALTIIFSVLLSFVLFNEKPSMINYAGIGIVFIGITLILNK